jgi:menaquinone-dependent protoporphyrinogen oxidase
MIADALAANGVDVVAAPVEQVASLDGFSGVVIGGALYADLWPWKVRRFVSRHLAALRRVPVWLFSSGPLDDSADHADIPPTRQVAILAEQLGAKGM